MDLVLPAEKLLRLVYRRLDPDQTSAELPGHEVVPELLQVFPGFWPCHPVGPSLARIGRRQPPVVVERVRLPPGPLRRRS